VKLAAILALLLAVTTARAQRVERDRYELKIPERVEMVAGAGGALPITIAVDRGQRISKDAAIILDLAPDAAIGIKKRRFGRADAVDPDADAPRFSVALRADTAGDYAMRVRIRFWLCGTKACRPVEARRNVAISVTAAPAPTPANPATP
jgi:hypothetical protein